MRTISAAFFLAGILAAGACLAGEPDARQPPVAEVTDPEDSPDPEPQELSNWQKFKQGAKQAGGAVASGTRNVAGKTAGAVSHGAKKTGEFFSEGYQDAKEYIHEKTE